MTEIDSYKKKIVLLGDAAVGKTSLIRRFVTNKFDDKYLSTMGTKVSEKTLMIKDEGGVKMNLKFLIWDFMGQKGFKKIERFGLRGTKGALIVYDISRSKTLKNIEKYWIPRLQEAAPDVPIVFLGNKIDLLPGIDKKSPEANATVDFQEMVNRYNATGYFTSALTGENVQSAFAGLGKMVIKNVPLQPKLQLPKRLIQQMDDNYESNIIRATDEIIMDFYKNYGSSLEETMPIIRKQFEKAGVDINNPTIDGLRKAIEFLGKVESSFWSNDEVNSRMRKRMSIIKEIDDMKPPNRL